MNSLAICLLALLPAVITQFQSINCLVLSTLSPIQHTWLSNTPKICSQAQVPTLSPSHGPPLCQTSPLEDSLGADSRSNRPIPTPATLLPYPASPLLGPTSFSPRWQATPKLSLCSLRWCWGGAAALTGCRCSRKVSYQLISFYPIHN